jgi:hypothetical protein
LGPGILGAAAELVELVAAAAAAEQEREAELLAEVLVEV